MISHLSWLATGLAFTLLSQVGLAHQLAPIEMLDQGAATLVARDSDYAKMDLLKAETFLWGGTHTQYPKLSKTRKLIRITCRSE